MYLDNYRVDATAAAAAETVEMHKLAAKWDLYMPGIVLQ